MKNMKRLGLLIATAVLTTAVFTGCTRVSAKVEKQVKNLESTIKGLEEEQQKTGKKEGLVVQGTIEAEEVNINTKIPGRIASIQVAEGQEVGAGEVLVVISSDEIKAKEQQMQALIQAAQGQMSAAQSAKLAATAQLNKAENGARPEEIAQAKSYYELMQKTYERVKDLYEQGAVAAQKKDEVQAQLDMAKQKYELAMQGARAEDKKAAEALVAQADSMVKAASGQVEQAKAGLKEVQSYLKDTSIKAPIAGVITTINSNAGELVSTGMPILTITKLDEAWVEVKVPETELSKVKTGQMVKVTLPAYADKVFRGEITRINAKPDFATKRSTNENGEYDVKAFGVKIILKDVKESLRPGMTAIVDFETKIKSE